MFRRALLVRDKDTPIWYHVLRHFGPFRDQSSLINTVINVDC